MEAKCPEATPDRGRSVTNYGTRSKLTRSPGKPLAGTDVKFELTGLDRWDVAEVTFYRPNGEAARWVTEYGVVRSWTTEYLRLDKKGKVSWVRYGSQDEPGDWEVHIAVGDTSMVNQYYRTNLSLPTLDTLNLGVPLRGCRSDEAVIYFSRAVNFAITVDMHAELERAADLLERRFGARSSSIPVIYLLGNGEELAAVSRFLYGSAGSGSNFHRASGDYPGLFLQGDRQVSSTYGSIAHLYVYYLLEEITEGRQLPRWLQAGLGQYFEYEIGLTREPARATLRQLLPKADNAQQAAFAGRLLSVERLEDRTYWNSLGGDQTYLKWDQSYMLVRYIAETYGDRALRSIVNSIAEGSSTGDAVHNATGTGYAQLEANFARWLANWDDPDRAQLRNYVMALSNLADEEVEITRRRNEANKEWNDKFDRTEYKKAAIEFRDASKDLQDRVEALQGPPPLTDLHEAAVGYFGVFNEWMTKQAEWLISGQDSYRVGSNELIPEFTYRRKDFTSRLFEIEYIYNLDN